jgi:hypothetical protein
VRRKGKKFFPEDRQDPFVYFRLGFGHFLLLFSTCPLKTSKEKSGCVFFLFWTGKFELLAKRTLEIQVKEGREGMK